MKKLSLLTVALLSAVSLSACGLSQNLNSTSSPSDSSSSSLTTQAAQVAAKALLSDASSSGIMGTAAKALTGENASLLTQIASGVLSSDVLMGLLNKVGLDGYVRNAASLQLASNLLGGLVSGNAEKKDSSLLTTALNAFNPSKADATQNQTHGLLSKAASLFGF